MSNYGPAFPESSDDGCAPYRAIADYLNRAEYKLNCDEYKVMDAFSGMRSPEWSTPIVKDNQKASTIALNRCALRVDQLIKAYSDLSQEDYQLSLQAGCVTIEQLRATHKAISSHGHTMGNWYSEGDRRGGRNIAAYTISEGIRRLFRRLRLPLTWGVSESGLPSTPFGRAVEFSLGEFGIISDWRGPTKDAWKKQKKIEGRLMAFHLSRHRTLLEKK
jgi:hypothetical protein